MYFVVYYGLFRFFIRKFNMATPGREPATTDAQADVDIAVAGGLFRRFRRGAGGVARARSGISRRSAARRI